MGRRGRLKRHHYRDGERRMAGRWERPEPVLVFADWEPPREWLLNSDDVEALDHGCEERVSAT